jgi:hypothetical protein
MDQRFRIADRILETVVSEKGARALHRAALPRGASGGLRRFYFGGRCVQGDSVPLPQARDRNRSGTNPDHAVLLRRIEHLHPWEAGDAATGSLRMKEG